MVEANSSAVVSALTLGLPVMESSRIEEPVAVEDHRNLVSSFILPRMEEEVSNPGNNINYIHQAKKIKVDMKQCCSQPSSSFLKPGCLETHL